MAITGQLGPAGRFQREATQKLNEMAREGWRLVTVDQSWAYFEREA